MSKPYSEYTAEQKARKRRGARLYARAHKKVRAAYMKVYWQSRKKEKAAYMRTWRRLHNLTEPSGS